MRLVIILCVQLAVLCSTSLCISLHTVPNPAISLSGPMQGAMVGSPQVITCRVSTVSGVAASLVMISWIGPGGDPVMTDSRVTISPTTSSNNVHTSNLQFTYLMEGDEGNYTCNVTIMRTNATRAQSIAIGNFRGEYSTLIPVLSKIHQCTSK